MEENSRHFFIGNSILSPEWIAKVKTGGPYLILAEGVFMYLTETDVKELFTEFKVSWISQKLYVKLLTVTG